MFGKENQKQNIKNKKQKQIVDCGPSNDGKGTNEKDATLIIQSL